MLNHLDEQFFLLINSCHSAFWDDVMWALSGKLIWVPLYITILVFLYKLYSKKIWILILVIALSVFFADYGSTFLFKDTVCRLRPCHEPSLEGLVHIVNGKCGGKYGFISSHASNSFNITVLTSLLFKKRLYSAGMILWACIICYSRIYLGVHYPGDILCGAFYGSLVGWLCYKLYVFIDRKITPHYQCFNNTCGKTDALC